MNCASCTRIIKSLKEDAFTCTSRAKNYHVSCCDGFSESTTKAEILILKGRKNTNPWFCRLCQSLLKRVGFNVDEAVKIATEKATHEITQLRTQHQKLINDSSDLNEKASDATRKAQQLQQEIDRLKQRNTELIQNAGENEFEYEDELKEMRRIAKEAGEQNRQIIQSMRTLEEDNKNLRSQLAELSAQKPKHRQIEAIQSTSKQDQVVTRNSAKAKRQRTDSDMEVSDSETEEVGVAEILFKFMRKTDDKIDKIMNLLSAKPVHAQATRTVIVANEAQGQPRSRSVSRTRYASQKRTTLARSVSRGPQRGGVTYAQALQASRTPVDVIRNINVIGTPEEMEKTIQKLRFDDAFADNAGLRSVKHKGAYSLTLKCTTEEEATKIEEQIQTRYPLSVQVKPVEVQPPMVKITRIFTKLTSTDEIMEQIQAQNAWIRDGDLVVTDKYSVNTSKGEYLNLICNCTLESQRRLI